MCNRRGARNQQDVWRALEQPGERDLHRCNAESFSNIGQLRRLQRREAAEREERHVGDVLLGAQIDERVVGPIEDAVAVLHLRDRRQWHHVELIVPELRRRELFRSEYESMTLRGNLGLPEYVNRYTSARQRTALASD